MKLLFDQNLSHRLVGQFAVEFPQSEHVRNIGLASAPDSDLWSYAAANGFVITSKDTDFEQRSLLYGHPPKVIWIRLGNCGTAAIANQFRKKLDDVRAFDADPTASFLILS